MTPPTEVILEGPFQTIIEEPTGHLIEVIGGGGGGGSGDAVTIQQIPVSATAPAAGEALVSDGTTYIPTNIATQAELDAGLALKADVVHTHSFASLTAKPTTLAGYGITDAALDADLDAHIADVANPHAVTKAQVGLGNVEDTALSTWAGSGSITTVGTLTSGAVPASLLTGTLAYARLPTGGGTWANGGALLITGGGVTINSGGLTVTAGGITLTGSQSITSTASVTITSSAGSGQIILLPGNSARVLINHTADIRVGNINSLLQGNHTGSNAGFSFARWSNNAGGPAIILGKSRGASIGTYAALSNNDDLGAFDFAGDDGNDLETVAARILGEVEGSVSANRIPSRIVFSVSAGLADNDLTEAWRITSLRVFQGAGASTIRAAGGDLTLATSSSGNVLLSPVSGGIVDVTRLLRTLASAAAAGAGLRIPHGVAPTSPVDGDMWTTTAGLFVRVNGVTKTVTLT